nr:hypothetical protein CFP56_24245 [Quercus suber]
MWSLLKVLHITTVMAGVALHASNGEDKSKSRSIPTMRTAIPEQYVADRDAILPIDVEYLAIACWRTTTMTLPEVPSGVHHRVRISQSNDAKRLPVSLHEQRRVCKHSITISSGKAKQGYYDEILASQCKQTKWPVNGRAKGTQGCIYCWRRTSGPDEIPFPFLLERNSRSNTLLERWVVRDEQIFRAITCMTANKIWCHRLRS